mmetsp:Transcript_34713/g.104217  ORF Transcript_34713/g.104217 Transcript_34713/m.104217 type:complete len:291 (+) Transcript_34713:1623-2495(+)
MGCLAASLVSLVFTSCLTVLLIEPSDMTSIFLLSARSSKPISARSSSIVSHSTSESAVRAVTHRSRLTPSAPVFLSTTPRTSSASSKPMAASSAAATSFRADASRVAAWTASAASAALRAASASLSLVVASAASASAAWATASSAASLASSLRAASAASASLCAASAAAAALRTASAASLAAPSASARASAGASWLGAKSSCLPTGTPVRSSIMRLSVWTSVDSSTPSSVSAPCGPCTTTRRPADGALARSSSSSSASSSSPCGKVRADANIATSSADGSCTGPSGSATT